MNKQSIEAKVRKTEKDFSKKQANIAAEIPSSIIKKAQQEGVKAFQSGKNCMTMAFTEYACKSEYSTLALMDAYNHGLTIAKLASGIDDSEMPSVKELTRIMA
jgi:hypothetical protein